MTVTATWKGTVIATSERTVVVERNHYFPPDDVRTEFLEPSDHSTACPWKGRASYYSVMVGEDRNRDAAWYYPAPSPAAAELAGQIAFWHGVDVQVQRGDEAGGDTDVRRNWRRWLARR
jgi:uncharacterized protein (DUF427 family)